MFFPNFNNKKQDKSSSPGPRASKAVSLSAAPSPDVPKLELTLILYENGQSGRKNFGVIQEELAQKPILNARQGVEYKYEIEFKETFRSVVDKEDAKREKVGIGCECDPQFAELGLRCRTSGRTLTIEGTPTKEFEGKIVVKTRLDSEPERACEPIVFDFCIFPDPYSLWQEKEPPEDSPYKRPHAICESAEIKTTSPINVLAASQRGRSHAHEAKFRDDCYKIRLGKGPYDWSFFAVADGAGSAQFSREGARLACETFIDSVDKDLNSPDNAITSKVAESVQKAFERGDLLTEPEQKLEVIQDSRLADVFHRGIYAAYEAILNEANRCNEAVKDREKAKVSIRDFATTALFLAAIRIKGDTSKKAPKDAPPVWALVSYWIGDGAFAIYRPNQEEKVILLGAPDAGEFAGQTKFLTMQDEIDSQHIHGRLRLTFVKNFKAIVMATDGISDPFFTSERKLEDYQEWTKFWDETTPQYFPGVLDAQSKLEERAEALKKGMMFKVPGNHDDRTMVLLIDDKDRSKE